jgi:CHAD domain-containing protein
VTPDLPADRAAVLLSRRLLRAVEANLPGTLAGEAPEFLHDLRVAVRRTRSLQRELKKVFPPDELAYFRREFKWVQRVTGPTRDLDVYLLEFGELPNADQLGVVREFLEEERLRERALMETELQSERTSELLRDWGSFLERLPDAPVDERPQGVTPIGEVAARRIERVYRQMLKMGRRVKRGSPPEALHDLRKKGKELRYLLEFFAPLFPRSVTKPMVRTLKSLQKTLGRHQDREVQAEMLRGLRSAVASRAGGAEALVAIDALVEHLHEEQEEARTEFQKRFAAFSAAEQRALVKKTFG